MTFYIAFGARALLIRVFAYDLCQDVFVKFEASVGISGVLSKWRGLRWDAFGFERRRAT